MTLIMEGQVVLNIQSHTVCLLKELHKILSFQPKRKASLLSTRFWVAWVHFFFNVFVLHGILGFEFRSGI